MTFVEIPAMSLAMKIYIGSDLSGQTAAAALRDFLISEKHEATLLSVSEVYPSVSLEIAHAVRDGRCERGIIVCATGQGISMMANKVNGVYACPCHHTSLAAKIAYSLRAQVLTLGCDVNPQAELQQIAKIYLDTPFGDRPNAAKMRELERIERAQDLVTPSTSREEVEKMVRAWQSRNETVAMASGTFELLHAGHLLYLTEMREKADHLVVAITGDKMASRKGPGRPLIGDEQRAHMVRALKCVDAAFVYHEWGDDTNLEIIRPNIFGRGDGYDENITEAATVKRLGIKLVITGAVPGLHTTEIIKKARV